MKGDSPMRCVQCNGHLHHLATTVDGKVLRECRTNMTVMGKAGIDTLFREVVGLEPCGLVYDEKGRRVEEGRYVYNSYPGKSAKPVPEALTIKNGRVTY